MLRTTINKLLINIGKNDYNIINNNITIQTVRWRRKPRWLPVAKSKLFRVPERVKQTPEESAELLRLHNIYKTQMRSLRSYFAAEMQQNKETSSADHLVVTPEQEEAEFLETMKINDEWNASIAIIRNKRIEKENKERAEFILTRLEANKLRVEEDKEKIEEIVKKAKDEAKTFITIDTLDQAIEKALANVVDYNFAIDSQGNLFKGRQTLDTNDITPAK